MINTQFNHVAFSDDSSHRENRYHSLSLVTTSKENYENLLPKMKIILEESGIGSEFKWTKLSSHKYRFAAEKIIGFVFENQSKIKVNTIIWDIEDSRHKNLIGRDDNKNLVRMYYHLFMDTTSKKWPIDGVHWKWMPDEQSSVDWEELRTYIRMKKHPVQLNMYDENELPEYQSVQLEAISPSQSENNPFIQIADLFAGIANCSYGDYERIKKWRGEKNIDSQLNLLGEDFQKFSAAQKMRFPVIIKLDRICKDNRFGISFSDKHRGLYSYPNLANKFLSFWLYTPQSIHDKAPMKKDVWPLNEPAK